MNRLSKINSVETNAAKPRYDVTKMIFNSLSNLPHEQVIEDQFSGDQCGKAAL